MRSQNLGSPLTTFKIDVEEIAKTAIDLLVDQIVHPRAITKTVLLGAELIERKALRKDKNAPRKLEKANFLRAFHCLNRKHSYVFHISFATAYTRCGMSTCR